MGTAVDFVPFQIHSWDILGDLGLFLGVFAFAEVALQEGDLALLVLDLLLFLGLLEWVIVD